MSYQVLARKWRPQCFNDVIGQEHVLTALSNALSLGRVHHAYLFSGTRGVGKTSIARILAKGLNCEQGVTATPCGQCANCQDIEQGRFVDLLEIDAASRTKVEDTREILDNVQYLPVRGRFKVYLIDEVHMLSRNSFNALLKTLEEPPQHVKFLLATTDPQKLPVTILSRCLQFHLRALDSEQISQQLSKILTSEEIKFDNRALQILARAADGSVRDALSLTDQAIAMGNGEVEKQTVIQMLGTLDDEQPLALIESLVNTDSVNVMTQIEQAAKWGVDWDMLLAEVLRLLHQIAMMQLLPTVSSDYQHIEQRLRHLARAINPTDLQLYYQIVLSGRKDLPYAPDKRMGAEMALLRALAFQPKSADVAAIDTSGNDAQSIAPLDVENIESELPNSTAALLKARQKLKQQESSESKKSEPVKPAATVLQRFSQITERKKASSAANKTQSAGVKDAYRWQATKPAEKVPESIVTPKALRSALECEKTPELMEKLIQESINRDSWSAEIEQLAIPRLAKQLALSAYKEVVTDNEVCLRLRSDQHHLNNEDTRQLLAQAMSDYAGKPIKLSIVIDDDLQYKTPLEWRRVIFEEKLAQARQAINSDPHIQLLCHCFDAVLDEESIQPV